MPEGDAVRRTAARLNAALSGKALLLSDVRVPRYATASLVGQTVTETRPVGKHLLTRTDAGMTVHSHLRMEGRWITRPAGHRTPGPWHQVRIILATSDVQAVGLRLGMLHVIPTSEESHVVGHLGPDILADEFDAADVAARIAVDERGVVATLLDQRVLCGLGTMWAAETAFVARGNPWEGSDDLGPALTAVRDSMLSAVTGTRVAMWVFERAGQPCRVCGTPIRSGRVGTPPQDRITYWCPVCQSRT